MHFTPKTIIVSFSTFHEPTHGVVWKQPNYSIIETGALNDL
jgi:hypothetical protein